MELFIVTGKAEGEVNPDDLKSQHAGTMRSLQDRGGVVQGTYWMLESRQVFAVVELKDRAEAEQVFIADVKSGAILYTVASAERLPDPMGTAMAEARTYMCEKGHPYDAFDLPSGMVCKADGTPISEYP